MIFCIAVLCTSSPLFCRALAHTTPRTFHLARVIDSKEHPIQSTPAENTTPALSFDALNWVATDSLPRDQEQSHRLHEPEYLHNSIDPSTGHDIENLATHPNLENGNLTFYFESEETRQEYLNTPFNHPVGRLPGAPTVDTDRGG